MLLRQPPFALFDRALDEGAPATGGEDQTIDSRAMGARLFSQPIAFLCARDVDAVWPVLEQAEAALAAGHWLAGWIAYEAAAAFEPKIRKAQRFDPQEPLIWLGVFPAPLDLSPPDLDDLFAQAHSGTIRRAVLSHPRLSETIKDYEVAFARIRTGLDAGELYQINYSMRLDLELEGDPLSLYQQLRKAQPVAYGAYVHDGKRQILSRSPELFVRRHKGMLETRPMKGTLARGLDLEDDRRRAAFLRDDEKSRAENLMIVDLLRNDLSRIAAPGSVEVPGLFEIEHYPTVLQMISRIRAQPRPDLGFAALIEAMMPCGSITGAPKIRAMEWIAALENQPRGIYTGAIGWAAPDGDLCFNVAIRTLVEQIAPAPNSPEPTTPRRMFRLGLGSGIVADSQWRAEYEECLLKGQFLGPKLLGEDCGRSNKNGDASPDASPDASSPDASIDDAPWAQADFALIETMLWQSGVGFPRLPRHLARLRASAQYFAIPYDEDVILRTCDQALAQDFDGRSDARMEDASGKRLVRLLLGRSGAVSVMVAPFRPWQSPIRLHLAPRPLHSQDLLGRHKTTLRQRYAVHDAAGKPLSSRLASDEDEIIFCNEHGHLCEGLRSNLFIRRGQFLLTPALDEGPLPGVLRAELLAMGQAQEARLDLDDLIHADAVYIGNAVRGLGRCMGPFFQPGSGHASDKKRS
ncbi:aminodeoxychorismate synthase component 1 [alpha proteobacterium Q-1]|nr:aminodeoxychorismate synthase component 1 [alpha proteobacterium Q-1]